MAGGSAPGAYMPCCCAPEKSRLASAGALPTLRGDPTLGPFCPGRLEKALSFRSGAKLALREFAAGGGAAFPRLRPAPSHAMQHLLIDARVALAPSSGTAQQQGGVDAGAEAEGFAAVSSLLESALADAGLLLQRRQQPARGASSVAEGEPPEAATVFFQCHDGYVAAVWHGASASLSGRQGWVGETAPPAGCPRLNRTCTGLTSWAASGGRQCGAHAGPTAHATSAG